MDKSSELPKPSPGVAFKLEGDGHWDVQRIPDDVLDTLEFSGELSIRGFRCSVFETPDGDQWAQKVPGSPAPKGDEAAEDVLEKMASRLAGLTDPTSSDVLDLLDESGIGSRNSDFSGIFDWIAESGNDDLFEEATEEAMENIRKAFAKAFPGEALDVGDEFNTIESLEHEINHLVKDQEFDLKGFSGKHGPVEGAVDEIALSFIEEGKLSTGAFDSISTDIRSLWRDGMPLKDFLDAVGSSPFEIEKSGSMRDNAVSFVRNKYKDRLDEPVDKRFSYEVVQDFVSRILAYLKKDVEISSDPRREAKYKAYRRLLKKMNDETLARLKASAAPREASLRRMALEVAMERTSKRGPDANIVRAAQAMLEELRSAEAAMDKARQFGRVLGNEQSLEWIVDQVDSAHDTLKGVLKGIEESLSYIAPD